MTSVNVTTQKNTVTVQQGDATTVTVTTQGAQGATGAGVTAGDKGSLTVAENLTDWTLNDSIVTNAKVSAGAAIAGTKISPDFGSQNITTTGNAVFGGNLTVSGTTTTIDSTTLRVEDKNIELGKVGSPTDTTADGGGISLLGDTTKTFQWLNATDSWTSSEHIALPDNKKLQIGDSQDLQIYHDGTASYFADTGSGVLKFLTDGFRLRNGADTEHLISADQDGGVRLYHDGTKKAETTADGVDLFNRVRCLGGDAPRIQFFGDENGVDTTTRGTFGLATGANQIVHGTGANDVALNTPHRFFIGHASQEVMAKFDPDGAVELYYDNVKKVETSANGLDVTGNVDLSSAESNFSNTSQFKLSNLTIGQHQNTGSYRFANAGNGSFLFTADNINFFNKDVNKNILRMSTSAVELYHDNVKKAETSANGLSMPDNSKLQLGDSQDLAIYHDGAGSKIENSTGSLNINTVSSEIWFSKDTSEYLARFITDGAVELYHDAVKRFETSSSGVTVSGNLFTGHLTAAIDGNTSISLQDTGHGFPQSEIKLSNGGRDLNIVAPVDIRLLPMSGENGIVIEGNGQVEIYHDNVKRFNTTADAVDVHGHINLGANTDNKRLRFGINNDLQLYHDGSNSFIDNSTGSLYIRPKTGEDGIRVNPDNGVQLYHDNTQRLSTSGIGVTVSGKITSTGDIIINSDYPVLAFLDTNNDSDYRLTNANGNFLLYDISNAATRFTVTSGGLIKVHVNVEPEADNTRALGSSSKRFTTLHSAALNTGDINMSNLNDNGNEVDGSKGSWTLQEGADDLFIINRVSGKKYKFNLTEIF